ncbi:MAG: hypothetical protein WD740_07685 [Anaerolineales bacterium]
MAKKKPLSVKKQRPTYKEVLDKKEVCIEVTDDTLEELKEIIQLHWWDFNEGIRRILGAGIGTLLAEETAESSSAESRIGLLSQRLVMSEGKLAGERFELSGMRQTARRLELSNNALHEATSMLAATVGRQNEELVKLKTQLKKREREIALLSKKKKAPA